MRNLLSFALIGLALVLPAQAQQMAPGFPGDAAVDLGQEKKTLKPRVVPNSGRLEWMPAERDLTSWTTLSHLDQRDARRPQRVTLEEPLAGNPMRGRDIAMAKSRGNCVACHELPGDPWPGTVGNSLLNYQRRGMSDARVYQQIYDARIFNPQTVMPPYGTNNLLNEQELRDLVAYLQNLE